MPDGAPIVVATFSGSVFGILAASGEIAWRYEPLGGVPGVMTSDRPYQEKGLVDAIGSIFRSAAAESSNLGVHVPSRLLVTERHVFLAQSGDLACLGYLTGAVVWLRKQSIPTSDVTLLFHEDKLVVGHTGRVQAFSAADGAFLWAATSDSRGHVALGVPGNAAQVDENT